MAGQHSRGAGGCDGTAGGGRTKTAARQGWATAHQGCAGGHLRGWDVQWGEGRPVEEPGKGVLWEPLFGFGKEAPLRSRGSFSDLGAGNICRAREGGTNKGVSIG